MLIFNQCLAFILALVIATEFNAERGGIALEKKPIIFGRSTGAASELCEAARTLQPLSDIGELVSHDTTAPKSFRTLEARQKGDSSETISSEYISTKSEHTSSSTSVSSTSSIHPSPDPGPDNITTCEAYHVFAEDSSYGPVGHYDPVIDRWVSRLSDARPPVYRNAQLISMGDKNYRLSFYGGGKITTGHIDIKMSSVELIGHIYERTNVGTVISVVVHGTDSDNEDKLATYLIRGRISDEEIDPSAFTTRRIEGFDGMDMRVFIGSQRHGASNNQILALSRNKQGKLLGLTLSPGTLTVSEPVDTGFVISDESTILYDVTPERKFFVAVYDSKTGVFGLKDMSTANKPITVLYKPITVLYGGTPSANGNIVAVTSTYEPGLMSIPATRRYSWCASNGDVLSVDYNPKSGLQMVATAHLEPSSALIGGDESSSDVYALVPMREEIAVLKPEMARNSVVAHFDISRIQLLQATPLKSPDNFFSGLYVDFLQDGNLVQYSLSVRSTPCFIFAIRDNFLTAKVGTKVPATYRVFAPVSPTENQVSYSLQYSNDFGDSWFTQDKNKKVPTHVDTGVKDPSKICGSSRNCQKHRIENVTPYREGAYTSAGETWIEITKEILPRYWRVVATNALGKSVSNTRFRKDYPISSSSSSAVSSSSSSAVSSSSSSAVSSSSSSAVPSSSSSAVPSSSSSAVSSSSSSAVPSSSSSAVSSSSSSAVSSSSSSAVPSISSSAAPSSSGSAVPSSSSEHESESRSSVSKPTVSSSSESTDTEKGTSVITTVVTKYTTYCPNPTTFVEGSSTYTAAEPTTWTITDCPCTLTQTVSPAVTEVSTVYTTSCPEPTVLTHETPKPASSGQTSEVPKPAPSGETDIPVPKGSGSVNSLNVALALAAFTLFWF